MQENIIKMLRSSQNAQNKLKVYVLMSKKVYQMIGSNRIGIPFID